jgi:hypothetical protein
MNGIVGELAGIGEGEANGRGLIVWLNRLIFSRVIAATVCLPAKYGYNSGLAKGGWSCEWALAVALVWMRRR